MGAGPREAAVEARPAGGRRLAFARTGTWRCWAGAATLARLPGNMAPLGLVLIDPGGQGALTASCFTMGVAAGAVWRGRAIDRAGFHAGLPREGLLLAGSSALLAVAIAARGPLPLVMPLAIGLGVTCSAVGTAYRAAVSAFIPAAHLSAAYSLDAALTEASFVVSPMLAAAMIAFAPAGTVFAVACGLAATSALLGRRLPDDRDHGPVDPARLRTWIRAAAPTYLLIGGVGVAYGLLQAGLPPRLADLGWSRNAAGVLFGIMSGTSMAAGVLTISRAEALVRRRSAVGVLLGVFAVALGVVVAAKGPLLAVAGMAVFGMPLAPLSAIATAVLTRRVPGTAHASALSVAAAVVTTTSGIGLALATVLLPAAGSAGTLAVSSGICAALAAGALLAVLRPGRRLG
jgi:hypothetical protein